VTKSSDNDSPFNNLGVVNLGYLPSLGEVDTETRVEANKVGFFI